MWVEFEEGDLEFPIWVGTFWTQAWPTASCRKPNDADGAEAGERPGPADPQDHQDPRRATPSSSRTRTGSAMVTLIEAVDGHVVTLDASGITVTDGKSGHEITLDAAGITISDGVNGGNEVILDGPV